jgi:SOS-response transcriptional repressor LexA
MLCEAIKDAIREAKPRRTMAELAPKLGITYTQLNNIANKRTKPSPEIVARIRAELRLPKTWPESAKRHDGLVAGQRVSLAGTPMDEVPIVGSVAAGVGLWNVDVERRRALVPIRLKELGSIGFVVDGDSMMPWLQEFDIAVFRERRKPLHRRAFLVQMPDGQDRVKFTFFERGDWYLVSMNPAYPPELMQPGTVIVGMLVGFFRVRGTRETMESDIEGLMPEEQVPLSFPA